MVAAHHHRITAQAGTGPFANADVQKPSVTRVSYKNNLQLHASVIGLMAPANDNKAHYLKLCKQIQNNPRWAQPTDEETAEDKARRTEEELKACYDMVAELEPAEAKGLIHYVVNEQARHFAKDPEALPDDVPQMNFVALAAMEERIERLLQPQSLQDQFAETMAITETAELAEPALYPPHVQKELHALARNNIPDLNPDLAHEASLLMGITAGSGKADGRDDVVQAPVGAGGAVTRPPEGNDPNAKALQLVQRAKDEKAEEMLRSEGKHEAYLPQVTFHVTMTSGMTFKRDIEKQNVPVELSYLAEETKKQDSLMEQVSLFHQGKKDIAEKNTLSLREEANTLQSRSAVDETLIRDNRGDLVFKAWANGKMTEMDLAQKDGPEAIALNSKDAVVRPLRASGLQAA